MKYTSTCPIKMASAGELSSPSKRPHVKTERMQEFLKANSDMSNQRQFKCPYDGCFKVLTTQPGLKYHLKTHNTSQDVTEFKCSHCSHTLKSLNGLKYHKRKCRSDDGIVATKSDLLGDEVCNTEYSTEQISEGEEVKVIDDVVEACLNSNINVVKQENYTCANQGNVLNGTQVKLQRKLPPLLNLFHQTNAMETNNSNHHNNSDRLTELKPLLPDRFCYNSLDKIGSGDDGKLTEFAEFATSPQSPLMQTSRVMPWDKPTGPVVRSLNQSMDSATGYEAPTKAEQTLLEGVNQEYRNLDLDLLENQQNLADYHNPLSCFMDAYSDGSDPRVSSSSPFPGSTNDLENLDGTWSHKWPTAVWQCFISETQIFLESENEWTSVESLAKKEILAQQAARQDSEQPVLRYAEKGLRLLDIQHYMEGSAIRLYFTPDCPDQANLFAHCEADHPFYVGDKGWCSSNAVMTAERYGIPCNKLEVGDICLAPNHPNASFSKNIFNNFSSDHSSPSYEDAVYALSSMAQQKNLRDLELSPKSKTGSPVKKRQLKSDVSKAKRPMNAFMLFAKEYRLEYTQKFPGKDNRAISVMLGDKWKKMNMEEQKEYTEKAKVLADHQKKIHPDCWKRKK